MSNIIPSSFIGPPRETETRADKSAFQTYINQQQLTQNSTSVQNLQKKLDAGEQSSTTLGYLNLGLNLIATLGNIWMAGEQLSLAKEQFSFEKEKFNKNFAASLYALKDKMLQREKTTDALGANTKDEFNSVITDQYYDNPNNANVYIPGVTDENGNYIPAGEDAGIYENTQTNDIKEIDRMIVSLEKTGTLPSDIEKLALENSNPNVDYSKSVKMISQSETPEKVLVEISATTKAHIEARTPQEAEFKMNEGRKEVSTFEVNQNKSNENINSNTRNNNLNGNNTNNGTNQFRSAFLETKSPQYGLQNQQTSEDNYQTRVSAFSRDTTLESNAVKPIKSIQETEPTSSVPSVFSKEKKRAVSSIQKPKLPEYNPKENKNEDKKKDKNKAQKSALANI